jgi:ABC-type polar amino acid transport system ATPase subunit
VVETVLEVRGLGKRYGETVVLADVSLTVTAGELVCVVGPSGAGKTTLLRIIAALTPADEGTVIRFGEPLDYGRRWPNDRRIGLVFQDSRLFPHLSALDNCLLAPLHVQKRPRARVEAEVMDLLERLGVAAVARQFPHSLSGGQRQRVAIARTLAVRPALVLLDEITANLDPENIATLLDVLRAIVREHAMTCLTNTHHLGFAERVADRLVFLDGGRVLADGPPAEVLRGPETPDRIQAFVAALRAV